MADPQRVTAAALALRHRDGHTIPIENFATAIVQVAGLGGHHGAGSQTCPKRNRLERDLRRQAAQEPPSQHGKRGTPARPSSQSLVTQALFAMTLVTRSIEALLPRRLRDAALEKPDELRQLQREALTEMRSLLFELRPAVVPSARGSTQAPPGTAPACGARDPRVGLSIR